MTPKQINRAIAIYKKTGDLKPLVRVMKRLLIQLGDTAQFGFTVSVLENLPPIVDSLKSLEFDRKKK